ncbi:hypothetical protein J1614_001016 [Plenodomus biglobosus]|nr:hypothetical protein J1614_001016 [Plenodomus biglobosus]
MIADSNKTTVVADGLDSMLVIAHITSVYARLTYPTTVSTNCPMRASGTAFSPVASASSMFSLINIFQDNGLYFRVA